MRRGGARYAAVALLCLLGAACSEPTSGPAPPVTPDAALTAPAPRAATAASEILPPIHAPGAEPGPADGARQVVEVTFSPAAPGEKARLQALRDGSWQSLAAATQDEAGVATFALAEPAAAGVALRGLSTSTAGGTTVTDVDPETGPWRLRFDEEFDGNALDTDVWDYRQRGEHAPDRGRGHAASSREAVRVGDGVATLSSMVDTGRPGYYLNGHISTEKSYRFRRGVASARVKFQRTRGQHGAFWVQAPGEPYRSRGPAQNGAEIDVAEFYGEGYPHGGLSHFVHFLKGHGNEDWAKVGGLLDESDLTLPEGQTWWNRYHVFSVEWTRDEYVFRIDGKATYRTSLGTSDREEFLVLSMLNSDWELPDLDRSTLPQSMQVDWVRVWQR